jgi:hypothetical protein
MGHNRRRVLSGRSTGAEFTRAATGGRNIMKKRLVDVLLIVTVSMTLLALPAWAQETQEKPEPQPPQGQPPAAAPEAAPAPTPPPAPGSTAPLVTKAKIVVEDKAKNDGKIEVVFTPEKGQPVTVSVLVAAKMKGKEIAASLATNLKVTLGQSYKVDASGEKVEIKGKDKQKFSIVVGSNNVSGLSIKVE